MFPGLFVGYLLECIGPDFMRTFIPIWPAVRYVWRKSLRVLAMRLVGHRWDRVAMDILDMSVTTDKGNWHVLVIVDCFSRWTEAWALPNKSAVAIADTFFQLIICRFGMPAVIHSDPGREFENHLMQELCLLLGAHKTRMTPYHLASDGLVEQFNRTLLMMLAMFTGEHRDDWDDLLPAMMMAYNYRSSVHYQLMFGEEC